MWHLLTLGKAPLRGWRLRGANLKLKAKKCFLFQQEVEYLGHVVSKKGIRPLTSKVHALTHWATPANLVELRSFLGLACCYKLFTVN